MKQLRFTLLIVVTMLGFQIHTIHAAKTDLTLLFTTATWSHIQEFQPYGGKIQGGVARRATVLRELRNEHPGAILVSGGADLPGSSLFYQYGGSAMGDVMVRLHYDVALASPFDLNAGGNVDGFKAFASLVNFPIVNSNLDLSSLSDIKVPTNTVVTANGQKVGFIGMVSEKAVNMFGPASSIRQVLNTDRVINENIDSLHRSGADIVILISDLGFERDKEIAAKYGGKSGITAIIGDSQDVIFGDPADLEPGTKPNGSYPLIIGQGDKTTLLVYGGHFGTYLGELNITLADGVVTDYTGKLHFLNDQIHPDPDIQKYVDSLIAGSTLDKIVVGQAGDTLPGYFKQFPWKETPLSDVYADAFLESGKPFGATVALVNSGSVTGTLDKGNITVADIYRIYPFEDWLIVMDLKGSQLMTALENSVSEYDGSVDDGAGRFLGVAGLTYHINVAAPPGKRISKVTVGGMPLDLNATYTTAVNDFMAQGGDEFTVLEQGQNTFNTELLILDVLHQYIANHSPLVAPMVRSTVDLATASS